VTHSIVFNNRWRSLLRLALKGSFLTVLTLGFYRFWYMTDLRRYFWAHTALEPDYLEYTGRGRELLLGFLIAIAVLFPINIMLAAITLEQSWLGVVEYIALILFLFYLAQVALYKARRYRLTRTLFRGVRFWQTGSGWAYGLRVIGALMVGAVTLGHLWPWMRCWLDRYLISHTHYGSAKGHFEGSGWSFFKESWIYWVMVLVPFDLLLIEGLRQSDIQLMQTLLLTGLSEENLPFSSVSPAILNSLHPAFGLAFIWLIVALILFYPTYRSRHFRWLMKHVHFDQITFDSDLKARKMTAIYGVFAFFLVLMLIVAIAGAGLFAVGLGFLVNAEVLTTEFPTDPTTRDILVYICFLFVFYFLLLFSYEIARTVYLRSRLWSLKVNSLTVFNIDQLNRVQAKGKGAGSFGEGMVDALDAGF
jgi:uncharacterized membrane protein YjgN (DUF898 family)